MILAPSFSVVVLQAKVSLDLITSLTLWHLMLNYIEFIPPSTHQMVGGFKDITTDINFIIKVLFWIFFQGVWCSFACFPKFNYAFYYSIMLCCCCIFFYPFFKFTSLWSRASIRNNLPTPTKVGLRPTCILPFPEPTCGIILCMMSSKSSVIIHHKRRMKLEKDEANFTCSLEPATH